MKKQTKLGLVLAAAALISVSVASLVSARGWVQEGAEWRYVGNDGEFVTDTIQTSGNTKFYLNEEGYMVKDYFLEDYDSATYYFGANGAMVTNTWVAIESDRVSETMGDYVPDNFWYYFQASGKAVKGSNNNAKKMTIDGKKYMFNQYGQMCSGWIKKDGEVVDPDTDEDGGPFVDALYYAGGDNDGALRAGWVTYYDGYNNSDDTQPWYDEKTILYFYFDTGSNKKVGNADSGVKTKKINGKTYAFDSTGIMLSGWDVVDGNAEGAYFTNVSKDIVYFSGEDDGHQVKKGWVYAVPAKAVDSDAYDDGEEKYFYFGSGGDATKDTIKKVNGKYYVFAPNGIMKTGLVIWSPLKDTTKAALANHYIDKLDMDYAEGSQLTKHGQLYVGQDKYYTIDTDGKIEKYTEEGAVNTKYAGVTVRLHYFGDDGARKTGTNTVSFADDPYTFVSTSTGNKASGKISKKYYAMGIQLKASSDIRFGLFQTASLSAFKAQKTNFDPSDYEVITTSGSQQKGANAAKKDADGNYWLIDRNDNRLVGIYSVNVKKVSGTTITTTGKIATSSLGIIYTSKKASLSELNTVFANSDEDTKKALNKFFFNYTDDDADSVLGGDFDTKVNDFVIRFDFGSAVTGYTPCKMYFDGFQYQSDLEGKSNVWIPFGVYDASSVKTASSDYTNGPDSNYYQIDLSDDYFVNCYWENA